MEKDDEVKGEGNSINYEARMLDTRVGRFLSLDPLATVYPELTPYQFASNTPIQAIDLDGLEQYHYTLNFDKKGKASVNLTHETHFTYEHWRWGKSKIFGINVPVPESYRTEDHKWVVHTGIVHEGLTPDNSQIYRMELSRQFDSKKEMDAWLANVTPAKLKEVEQNYTTLDKLGHYLYIIQDVYRDSRPGGGSGTKKSIVKSGNAPKQLIKNKLPVSRDGKLLGSIQNGNVKMYGKTQANGNFDFIVTEKGDVLLGRKHSFMSGGSDVQAAGILKMRNGKIVNIDNNSGHYTPNLEEAKNFKEILKKNGVDVSNAHLKVYDENGNTIHHEVPKDYNN